jgi:ABC-type sugar transport system ATPase subunit
MTVGEAMELSMRLSGASKAEIARVVVEVAEVLG